MAHRVSQKSVLEKGRNRVGAGFFTRELFYLPGNRNSKSKLEIETRNLNSKLETRNRTFGKNGNFGEESKFWPKIDIKKMIPFFRWIYFLDKPLNGFHVIFRSSWSPWKSLNLRREFNFMFFFSRLVLIIISIIL